jgi:XTP/dITP diphosphohydrolase
MVGTKNRGKLVEIQRILLGHNVELMALSDFPQAPDVVEDGLTYRDNAIKKARAVAAWSGQLTLAEDSGLEVAALGGQPGIYTARFGGPGLSARERCLYLLEHLRDVPEGQRQAAFHCVAVLMDPTGHIAVRQGQCPGMIGWTLQGEGGFGYDPLFLLPEQGCSLAELSPEKKDMISHRAQAIRAMLPVLTSLARGGPWTPE